MAKKPARKDWHKADIKAALHRINKSLRSVAHDAGYGNPDTINRALRNPYPKAERLIAAAMDQNLTPQDIWPSRYHKDGSPKSGRGERGLGRYKALHKAKSTPSANAVKVNSSASI